jgi:predicted alpha/beta hydrolase family esterase
MTVAAASLLTGFRDSGQDLRDGVKVDMGGWSLYIQCKGKGRPTVVLDAGLDNAHTDWKRVEPLVVRRTRTCSYDRAGVGKSDARPSAPTVVSAEQVVDELRDLLARAGVSPPYVLVGHSIGGLNARLFTARHSGDVAGLVFVDPTSPEYFGRGETWREGPNGAAISYATAYDSERSVTLGDRPIIVLHAWSGRASTFEENRKLANRTSNGLLVYTRTGHGIHREKPNVVVEAIRLVLNSARSHSAIPRCRKTDLRGSALCALRKERSGGGGASRRASPYMRTASGGSCARTAHRRGVTD